MIHTRKRRSEQRTYVKWHNELSLLGYQRVRHAKRLTLAPNEYMRTMQHELTEYVRSAVPELWSSTGCRPGDSPKHHLLRHRGHRHFFVTDLVHAYEYVDPLRLATILAGLNDGWTPADEWYFYRLRFCFLNGEQWVMDLDGETNCFTGLLRLGRGLVRGAPASPELFNLYADFVLDEPVRRFLDSVDQDITYGRYLDDMVFSSDEPISPAVRNRIRLLISQAGFYVNHRKSRVLDLKKGTITLNGIGIRRDWRLYLPRTEFLKIRGLLHTAMKDPYTYANRVKGHMQRFFHVTSPPYNRSEKELVRTYIHYKRLLRNFRNQDAPVTGRGT